MSLTEDLGAEDPMDRDPSLMDPADLEKLWPRGEEPPAAIA